MELSGTLPENLRAAITSTRRLRGDRVHPDTLQFWDELLAFARKRLARVGADDETAGLIAALEAEIAVRAAEAI